MKNRVKKQSITDLIEQYMSDGCEWSAYALRDAIFEDHRRYHSDGTISRRMRDLRDRGYELSWRYSKLHTEASHLTLYKISKV